MTNEEAIKWLSGEMNEPCGLYCIGEYCKHYENEEDCKLIMAHNMAIEALEQQQRYKEFFRDLFDEKSTANFKIIKE